MARGKGGLGRGLESLFEDATPSLERTVESLPLREIDRDPNQPRKNFDEDALAELAKSIAEHGMLQPITVRPRENGGYTIIAGERRWRAARLAGLQKVPVIVKNVTDEQAMEIALVENLQREDLDPLEEAAGIRELMERCDMTQEQAAEKLGKSRPAVANSLRLLKLPESVLPYVRSGQLSAGHAKVLLGLPNEELMRQAAEQIVQNELNVRQTEQLCKRLQREAKPPKPESKQIALPREVELSLREILGNEVKVAYKDGKGSLTVHFYSDEQLRAFANLLGNYDKTGEA